MRRAQLRGVSLRQVALHGADLRGFQAFFVGTKLGGPEGERPDFLVVLGKPGELYAVGVLRGPGRTSLAVEGDLDVAASGSLRLRGAKGVAIEGGDVTIEAGRQTTAKTVVEVVGSFVQRVTGLFSQQVRDVHVHAEGSVVMRGKNATILTEESVVVNGEQLFLG